MIIIYFWFYWKIRPQAAACYICNLFCCCVFGYTVGHLNKNLDLTSCFSFWSLTRRPFTVWYHINNNLNSGEFLTFFMTVCALASGFRFLNQSAYIFFLFIIIQVVPEKKSLLGVKCGINWETHFRFLWTFVAIHPNFYSGFPSGNKPHVHINIFLFIDNLFFINKHNVKEQITKLAHKGI